VELMTDEIAQALREASGKERPAKDTAIVVKYLTPDANATWFITDGEEVENGDWHLFGFCDIGDRETAELGYVLLSQLRSVRGRFGLPVERDLHYSGTLADVLKAYGKYYQEFLPK
jgi:hypothetical protein